LPDRQKMRLSLCVISVPIQMPIHLVLYKISVITAVEEPFVRVQVAEDAVNAAIFERQFVVIADEAAFSRAVHSRVFIVAGGAVAMRDRRGCRRERGQRFQIFCRYLARMCSEHAAVMQLQPSMR